MAVVVEFVECTSVSITYDIYGVATVTYTVVYQTDNSDDPPFIYYNPVTYGGRTYTGYVSNMNLNKIPETENWFECQVTLTTTTESAPTPV